MIFGGVPKYLEEINLDRSFNRNMNRLCFSPHGSMVNEVERLFYSQFRETQTYKKIVELLKTGIFSLEEISRRVGFASERFCLRHSGLLAGRMGFRDDVLLAAPHFGKGDQKFQVDLLYQRSDRVITVCEIKHRNKPISREIIPEMERKCRLLNIPAGYTMEKALVSLHGPDESLKETAYFHHSITLGDII